MTRKEWRMKHPLLNKIQRTKDHTLDTLRSGTEKHPEWEKALNMRLELAIRDYNIVKEIEDRYVNNHRIYKYKETQTSYKPNDNPLRHYLIHVCGGLRYRLRNVKLDIGDKKIVAQVARLKEQLSIAENDLAIVNAMQMRYYK